MHKKRAYSQVGILITMLCFGRLAFSLDAQHVPMPTPPITSGFWQVLEQVQSHLTGVLQELPATLIQDLLFGATNRGKKALVRTSASDDISAQEKDFISKRSIRTRKAQEKFLGHPLPTTVSPSIALSFSGGGFRAMVSTLGFLKGAEEIGLLDSTDYMAGLSGSTWALAPWIASDKSIQDYVAALSVRLGNGIQPLATSEMLKSIVAVFLLKVLYGKTVNAMDIYGALLANLLLADLGANRFRATLSSTHQKVLNGKFPLPIYTAVQTNVKPYEWAEVTPFELGSTYLKSYVPVWGFGRTFSNGISTDQAPEETLGYLMGIFGSAFEANMKDAIEHSADIIDLLVDNAGDILGDLFHDSSWYYAITVETVKKVLPQLLKQFFNDWRSYLDEMSWSEARLFPDWQPNFTYKLEGTPLMDHEKMTLVDGGFAFNLPIPALLRPARKINVIIICDTSSSIASPQGSDALKKAQDYADAHKLKFPVIDSAKASRKLMSIFSDPNDPEVPLVIYFPVIANPEYSATFDPKKCTSSGYCATTNFAYTPEQVNQLSGLVEFTVKQQAPAIKQAISAHVKALEEQASSTSAEKEL